MFKKVIFKQKIKPNILSNALTSTHSTALNETFTYDWSAGQALDTPPIRTRSRSDAHTLKVS